MRLIDELRRGNKMNKCLALSLIEAPAHSEKKWNGFELNRLVARLFEGETIR